MVAENRSVLSDSGRQGAWALGNRKCISSVAVVPGLIPKLCFLTI